MKVHDDINPMHLFADPINQRNCRFPGFVGFLHPTQQLRGRWFRTVTVEILSPVKVALRARIQCM